MFTMNQIRNMFYAMLNQSMEITRTTAAEERLDKFDIECARLDATDKELEKDIIEKDKKYTDRYMKFKEEVNS